MKKRLSAAPPKVSELADLVNGTVVGKRDRVVKGICPLDEMLPDCLAFTRETRIAKIGEIARTKKPAALLVSKDVEGTLSPDGLETTFISVSDPLAALVELLPQFYSAHERLAGVSPKAEVHKSATIGKNVSIGAFSVIGADVRVDDDVTIHPHVTIYPGVSIGKRAVIHSGAVIREDCILGADIVVQNGAVIGADGFGYFLSPGAGLKSVPQVGIVRLADGVDVGANACIDRATLGTTAIGQGSKLDNLVQIGHNVTVGRYSIICGHAGIAGSCRIGDQVTIGGNVGIADHLTISDGCRVGGQSGVTNDLSEKGEYVGYPAQKATDWRRQSVALKRLPALLKQMKNMDES